MKRTLRVLVIFFAFLITSAKVSASEIYVECNLCSDFKRELAAMSWARINIQDTNQESKVVVIDLANREANTYVVSIGYVLGPPGHPPIRSASASLIATSVYVKEKLDSLDKAVGELATASENSTVPIAVVPDAWQFVNCASCENDLSDYLNEQLRFQVETMTQTMQVVAEIFGVSTTGVPDIFQVSLEGGGSVEFSAQLFNDPLKLKITVIKVIDRDNLSLIHI